jgi:hypothetical protein
MSLGRRNSVKQSGGPPTWLVFLVGVALVFGLYYIWLGFQNFLRSGGGGVVEATQRAEIISTATAESIRPTRAAVSATPIPECQDFVVIVATANVREAPNQESEVVTVFRENETVCVFGKDATNAEWYVVNLRPESRRLELAYMHESVLQALNPTPTATHTPTPSATLTPAPTLTASDTALPQPSATRDPDIANTPLATITPTPTLAFQSA